jgi:fumarylacetoacetase
MEYQPLGPFLSKSFATTISPCGDLKRWSPSRAFVFRPPGDPQPSTVSLLGVGRNAGGIDLNIEVYIRSMLMREGVCNLRVSAWPRWLTCTGPRADAHAPYEQRP